MTSFNGWKLINEFKSVTTRGLGGAMQAGRVETGFDDLIKGNLPPMQKALALVDVLSATLAQLEEDERKIVINAVNSKLKTTVSKVVKSLGSNV